jgi:hypothetical protein
VAVATFTAVASVVTPTVVPTVVPTALKHQNKAIAAAATDLASHLRGPFDLASARADKRLFPIPFNRPFLSHAAACEILVVTAKRTFLRLQSETRTHEPPRQFSAYRSLRIPESRKTA